MFCSDAIIYYYRQHSSFKLLSKRMINYGIWRTSVTKKYPDFFETTFFIPFIMVNSVASLSFMIFFYPLLANVILLGLIFYLIVLLIGSLYLSIKDRSIKYFIISTPIYTIEHFSIGLGLLIGIFKKLPNNQIGM